MVWSLRAHQWRKILLKSGRLVTFLMMAWGLRAPPSKSGQIRAG